MKIAVIGFGINKNLRARLLSTAHDVELFEANDNPGGHTNTVRVEACDTGTPRPSTSPRLWAWIPITSGR